MTGRGAPTEDRRGGGIRLRRPTEADYSGIAAIVDDWWDDKVVEGLLPRFWFRHFCTTSWIADVDGVVEAGEITDDPRSVKGLKIAGFLIGYFSPGKPGVGVIHAVGVDPNRRRVGVGRALVEAFVEDAAAAGITASEAVLWPGNRRGLLFLAALRFRTDPDAEGSRLYGVPAIAGYDFGTGDRARYIRGD